MISSSSRGSTTLWFHGKLLLGSSYLKIKLGLGLHKTLMVEGRSRESKSRYKGEERI